MPLQGGWGPEVARIQARGHSHQRKHWVTQGQNINKSRHCRAFCLLLQQAAEKGADIFLSTWCMPTSIILFPVYLIVLPILPCKWFILLPFYRQGSQISGKLGNLSRARRGQNRDRRAWWGFKASALSGTPGALQASLPCLLSPRSQEWRREDESWLTSHVLCPPF